MKHLRRLLIGLGITGVSLVLLYLIGANVFLAVGLKPLIAKRKLAFGYETAWTVWPARVHVRGFHIASQSDTVEWGLDTPTAMVDINLFDLLKRRVHLTYVRADGLSFRFRLRVMPNEAEDPKLAALPPIAPFEDPPIRAAGAPGPELLRGAYRAWVVQVDASDAQVREIWVGPYHFEGDAFSRGGFLIEPHRAIGVGPAVLELKEGSLRISDRVMAEAIEGVVTCDVERFNPDEKPGWEMLGAFSSSATAKAKVPSLDFIGFFVPNEWVRFDEGGGPTEMALRLEKGKLAPESWVSFETARMRLASHGFSGTTDARVLCHVADDERVVFDASSATSTLVRDSVAVPPVTIKGARASFVSPDGDLTKPLRFGGLSADVPSVDMPDMRWITGIHKDAHVRLDSGHAVASSTLRVDAGFHAKGEVTANVTEAALKVKDSLLRGNVEVKTGFDSEDIVATRKIAIKHGTVTLSRGGVWRDGDMTPITARIDVDGGDLSVLHGFAVKLASHAAIIGSNAVLDLVGVPKIAKAGADLLVSSRATTYAVVSYGSDLLTLKLTDGASGAAKVNGELRNNKEATEAAFVISALGFSVGVRTREGKLELAPEAGEDWLKENRPTLTTHGRRVAEHAEHAEHTKR